MRLLLDTNALLWWFSDDPRLGAQASNLIKLESNQLFVSEVTLFEVAIKSAIGKLRVGSNFLQTITQLTPHRLNISDEHLRAYRKLPLHHRDPYDRMLIAQAKVEQLTILTSDPAFTNYQIPVLDLRA